jgi:hypothetical protein
MCTCITVAMQEINKINDMSFSKTVKQNNYKTKENKLVE